jgi:formate hydrogenlyase transcriptional activator
VPALRQRHEDILLLVRHFARSFAGGMGRRMKWIPSSTMDALMTYSWSGNICELHPIELAVIRSAGERLNVPVSDTPAPDEEAWIEQLTFAG